MDYSQNYNQMNVDPGVFGGMMLAFGAISLVFFLVVVVLYLIFAFSLFKMAKNEGVENAWFSFIPILQSYIVAKIAEEVKIGSFVVPRPELVLTLGVLLGFIPFIGFLFSIAIAVVYYAALYAIYKKYRGDKAVVMLIISIVTAGIGTIVYFSKLKNESPLYSGASSNTYTL